MRSLFTRGQPVQISPPKNYSGATADTRYVGTIHNRNVDFVIYTGAWAGGTAAVTLLQATDASGTGAKALELPYYWTNKDDTGTPKSPVLVRTQATGDTFDLDVANSTYGIRVDEDMLDTGFTHVAIAIASPGANADFYSVEAIVSDLRWRSEDNMRDTTE